MLSTTPTWDWPQPKRKQSEPDPQVPEPPNKQQHVQQPGCMATNLARGTLPPLAVLFTLYSAVDISRRCAAPSDVAARVEINTISEEPIPPPTFTSRYTAHAGQLWQARQWAKACWLNETTGSKWSTRICDLLIKDNETRMNAEFKQVRQNTTQKKRRAREREEAPDDHQAHLDERRGGPRQYKRVRTRPSFPIPHYLSLIALSHCTSLPHSAPRRTPTPRSRPRPHPSRSGAPSTMINWSISSSAECFRKPLLI